MKIIWLGTFFDPCLEASRNPLKSSFGILVETMTQRGHFGINWPLCKKLKKKYTKEFKCNDCGASFFSKGNLKGHINAIHLKLKPYECDQCKKSFPQKREMEKHAKIIHLNCTDCDYSSISKTKLKIHVETVHQKARTHKCDHCKKSFSQKCNLSRHVDRIRSFEYHQALQKIHMWKMWCTLWT